MNRVKKYLQKPAVVVILGGLVVFIFMMFLRVYGQLEWLELASYDWFVRMAPKQSTKDPRVTFIGISEDDIRQYGRWPITDESLARALKIVLKDHPRAVGLDIYRDILVPPGSQELINLFTANPQIIGVMTVGEKGVPPLAVINKTDQVGFSDIIVDPGGIVRKGLLFLDDGKDVYYSFALRLASLYLREEGISPQSDPENTQHIRLKDQTIKPFEANDGGYMRADARGYQFLLDFKDMETPFPIYSFSNLMEGRVPAKAVAGKVVLVGVIAQSVKDHFYTPLSRGFDDSQQIPGVVLHGHMISQLLRFALDGATPIKTMTEKQKAAWLMLWCLAGALIGLRIRAAWRFSLMMSGGLSLLFAAAFAAFLSHWWIPLAPPSMSFFLSAVVVTAFMSGLEKKERTLLMQLFSRHVSPEIAEVIWAQRDQFMNNGRPRSQKMTVTVFFSDMKGFTKASEKLDPQDLIDWLNSYMEAMTRLIMNHGGVIDDYAGDGIKANFGVPLPRKNEEEISQDALNAVTCALEMEKEMCRLNVIWIKKGFPTMGTRIGIFTGTVVTGLLGSSQRMKYTTVGDTVNVAARLESYDKEVARDALCRILIGDATRQYVNGRFQTESIGTVSLKGKEEKISVHRVLGEQTAGVQSIAQEGRS